MAEPFAPPQPALACWTNDTDTIVACSADDAWSVWEEHTGEKRDDYPDDEWRRIDDHDEVRIRLDGITALDLSRGALQHGFSGVVGDAARVVVDLASVWARENGRCFLCSTEW